MAPAVPTPSAPSTIAPSREQGRKLNFHLPIPDGDVLDWVRTVNRAVRELTQSVVDFDSTKRPMTPHITLVMGFLHDGCAIADALAAASGVVRETPSIDLAVRHVYLERARHEYAFADVAAPPAFYFFRQRLHEALVPRFVTVSGLYSAVPHIKLAHVTANHTAVQALLTRADVARHLLSCDTVALSDVGPEGSCIGRIWSCALTNGPRLIRSTDGGASAPPAGGGSDAT